MQKLIETTIWEYLKLRSCDKIIVNTSTPASLATAAPATAAATGKPTLATSSVGKPAQAAAKQPNKIHNVLKTQCTKQFHCIGYSSQSRSYTFVYWFHQEKPITAADVKTLGRDLYLILLAIANEDPNNFPRINYKLIVVSKCNTTPTIRQNLFGLSISRDSSDAKSALATNSTTPASATRATPTNLAKPLVVTLFIEIELVRNLTQHDLFPKDITILNAVETKQVLTQYKCSSLQKLPYMSDQDMVSRIYGLAIGTVVRFIRRYGGDSPPEVYYRVVSPSPNYCF